MLGNTAAICRKFYIHPTVIDNYMDGKLAQTLPIKTDSEISDHLHELKPEEAAVLSSLAKRVGPSLTITKEENRARARQRAKEDADPGDEIKEDIFHFDVSRAHIRSADIARMESKVEIYYAERSKP